MSGSGFGAFATVIVLLENDTSPYTVFQTWTFYTDNNGGFVAPLILPKLGYGLYQLLGNEAYPQYYGVNPLYLIISPNCALATITTVTTITQSSTVTQTLTSSVTTTQTFTANATVTSTSTFVENTTVTVTITQTFTSNTTS
jgi:hypothetical protein